MKQKDKSFIALSCISNTDEKSKFRYKWVSGEVPADVKVMNTALIPKSISKKI